MIRFPRFSTRFRVALAAALATGITLGGGAIWFVHTLENNVANQAGSVAATNMYNLIAEVETAGSPDKINTTVFARGPLFEIVDRSGTPVTGCPNPGQDTGHYLAPPKNMLPSGAYYLADRTAVISFPPLPDFTTLTRVLDIPCGGYAGQTWQVRIAGAPVLGGRYVLYAAGLFDESGQAVVDNVRRQLFIGVPLVALLVAVVAWFAVRGSLRPVAAIRAEVAKLGATDLGKRVPVPNTGDELTDLATTMNAMLHRISESVDRQRQFIGDASHELKTPLTSMRTQLEVLFAHSDVIDWRQATGNVALDVERMQDLVADLLLLAKLDDQAPARSDKVELSELAMECFQACPPSRPGASITLDCAPAWVVGDRAQLARLINNLLENAQRHAATNATISIGPDAPSQAVITVHDDGPGIPAADRERVFDRFVRLDEARSVDSGGTGLGLAIVRDIAHAHGGTVVLTDNNPGARFVVSLPLLDA